MPLFNSPLFMVALFNVPAIFALVLCISQTRSSDLSTQKNIKLLLKIGIAKSLGGVLLAAFMYARFMSFASAQDEEQYGVYFYMKKLTHFATMSAIVDLIYAVLAYFLVQYTRIIKKSLITPKTQKVDFSKEKITLNLENITVSPRSSPKTSPRSRDL